MSRHSIVISLLLASSPLVAAGTPEVEWIAAGGGAKSDKTRAICFDRAGNVFLAGEMSEGGKFGAIEVKSGGSTDFFIAKLDPQGHFLWAHQLGGKLVDRGYGVATDPAGNAYVTGHYQSVDAVADGRTLPNAGDYDIFVAKYDPEGKLLWVQTAGGKGYDYGHGIAVDGNGDVVVTGAIASAAKFGEVTAGGDGRPIFCAKYSSDGTLKWVKTTSGKASGSGHGIAVDGSNHIYIGGSVSGEGMFGKQPVSAKGQAAIVAKLSPEGEALWVTTTIGGGAHEIAADAEGRVWLAGMFKGSMTLGKATYSSTGDKDNDGFLAHFDTHGALQWSRVIQGPAVDYCLGVATDGEGTSFVCGEFTETAAFAGQSLTSRGATDIQIGALDEMGKLLWLTQVGGTKGDNAYTMAYHPDGHLAIGGACVAPATFGEKALSVSGGADCYGAKVRVK
ncbi:MAG: SBBP repeat-containing protein [Prosthecobacter sp.]|nr:SBBP repeat-containing protein [Prosthecobacter sp.]